MYCDVLWDERGSLVTDCAVTSQPQSVAVEGYETGEHAPGVRLSGTGAYRAAHHIIKVWKCRFYNKMTPPPIK